MSTLRHRLHTIIFEAETPAGKLFDMSLIGLIVLSLLTVILESVASIRNEYGVFLTYAEYIITIIFSLEYVLRIFVVNKPFKYIFSFYGMIDLIAILPTYLSLLFPGIHVLLSFRAIRLLRVFRLLKLVSYMSAADAISESIYNSRRKISVFIFVVLINSILFGSVMYVVEGEENGFVDIPTSIYWSIVTMTTVGYGDISPVTALGKLIAVVLMIMGFGVIAVPTGIVSAEMAMLERKKQGEKNHTESCRHCLKEGHDTDAAFCKHCGEKLN
jgi:voltage-gated potassium channel